MFTQSERVLGLGPQESGDRHFVGQHRIDAQLSEGVFETVSAVFEKMLFRPHFDASCTLDWPRNIFQSERFPFATRNEVAQQLAQSQTLVVQLQENFGRQKLFDVEPVLQKQLNKFQFSLNYSWKITQTRE